MRKTLRFTTMAGVIAAGIGTGFAVVLPADAAQASAPRPAAHANAPHVTVWATSVNVRRGGNACNNNPSIKNCPTVTARVNPGSYPALCQQSGQTIKASGYSSKWWTWITTRSGAAGFVSNVYLKGPAHLNNVPNCVKN
jgi:hypothetical protein